MFIMQKVSNPINKDVNFDLWCMIWEEKLIAKVVSKNERKIYKQKIKNER